MLNSSPGTCKRRRSLESSTRRSSQGSPSLFVGGAAFPGNDWILSSQGEDYLSRIPMKSHGLLRQLRSGHLRFTRDALRKISAGDEGDSHALQGLRHKMSQLRCP